MGKDLMSALAGKLRPAPAVVDQRNRLHAGAATGLDVLLPTLTNRAFKEEA